MQQVSSKLLVCGATFAGIGAALAAQAAGRSVVVIERSALLGGEFIEAFQCRHAEWKPRTDWGQWLYRNMRERGIIGEDGCSVYLAALHSLLCLLVREQRLQVRMMTEIVEVGGGGGQYEVELHDIHGKSVIRVGDILDTTSRRLTCPGQLAVPIAKSLHAYLHHPEGIAWNDGGGRESGLTIATWLRPFQATLQLEVPVEASWPAARQQLHRCWTERPDAWGLWTIAAIAGSFASKVPAGVQRIEAGWSWFPSEAYANPLDALDHGSEFGAKEWGRHAAASS